MKKLTYITYLLSVVGMYFGLTNQATAQCPANPTPPMPSQYCVDSANFPINILGTHINWYSDNQLPTPGLNNPVTSTMVQAGFTYWIVYSDTTNPNPGLNTTTGEPDCGTAQDAIAVTFVLRGTPPTLPNGGLVCVNPATGCFALNSVPGIFSWYEDVTLAIPLDLNAIGGCVGPGTYYATIQDANGCETQPATLTVRAAGATPGTSGGYAGTLNQVNGCDVFCPDPIVGGINLDTLANNTTFADPPVDLWYEDSMLTVRARGVNGPGTYYGVNVSGQCSSAPLCIIIDDVPTAPVVDPVMTCVPFAGIDIDSFCVTAGPAAAGPVPGCPGAVARGSDLNWYTDANLTNRIYAPGDATPFVLPMPAPGSPVQYWVTYGGPLSPACESAPTIITLKGTPDTILSYNCPFDPGPVGSPSGGFGTDCPVGTHFLVRSVFCINEGVDPAVVDATVRMAPRYSPLADSLCYYADSAKNGKATIADLIANSTALQNPVNTAVADTFYVTQWIDGCESYPTAVAVYREPKPVLSYNPAAPNPNLFPPTVAIDGDTTVCPGTVLNLADFVVDDSARTHEWYFYTGDPANGGTLIIGPLLSDVASAGVNPGAAPDPTDPGYPVEVVVTGPATYYIVANHNRDPFVNPNCTDTITYTVNVDPVPFTDLADATVCSDDSFGVSAALAVAAGSAAASGFNVSVSIEGGLTVNGNPLPSGPVAFPNPGDTWLDYTASTSGEMGFLQGGDLANQSYTNTTGGPLTVTYIVNPVGNTANACVGPADTFVVTVNPAPATISNTDAVTCNLDAACVDFALDNGLTNGAWTLDSVILDPALVKDGYTQSFTPNADSSTFCLSGVKNETTGPLDVTVYVNYTNACGVSYGTATITVNPGPVIESDLSDFICSGQTTNNALSTTAASLDAIGYKWTGPAFVDYSGAAATANGGEVSGGTNSDGAISPAYGDWVYNSTFPLGQVYIRDSFVNTSGQPVVAIYNVIALGDTTPLYGCQSDTMTVRDTIMPQPLFTALDTFDLCSDGAIINLTTITPTQVNGPVPGTGTWYRSSHGSTGPVSGVQSVSNGDIFFYTYVTAANCTYTDTLYINLDEAPLLPAIPNPAVCAATVGSNLAGGATIDLRDYMPNVAGNGVGNVTFGGGGNAPGDGSWYAGAAATGTPIDTALNALQQVANGDQFTYEFVTDPDNDGNVCTATATVTVTVNEQPYAVLTGGGVICPAPAPAPFVQATFDGLGPWTVSWTDGTTIFNNVVVANNPWTIPNSGTTPGSYQVLSAVDQNGCTYTGPSNSVNVDTNGVVAICADHTVYLNGSGFIQIATNYPDNGSVDGCNGGTGNLLFSLSNNTFTCADIGVNVVEMYVTNGTDSDTCSANITVHDALAPVVICPLDIADTDTFSTDAGECYATAPAGFFSPRLISDNCEVDSIWYTYTICDSTYVIGFSGFAGEYSQQNAQGNFGTNVPVFGTINLGGATLPKGSYDITLYVKDKQGHNNGANTGLISSCTKSVVIEDNEAPTFTFVTPDTIDVYTSSLQGQGFGCKADIPEFIESHINSTNCQDYTYGQSSGGIDVVVTRSGFTNDTIQGLDWQDNCKIDLVENTADASGAFTGCHGDIASIDFTITDCGGNTATETLYFRINDDEDPVITCPADTILDCDRSWVKGDTSLIDAAFLGLEATATDNSNDCAATCTQPVITYEDTYPNYASPCIGPDTIYVTRTWTVTDQAGNTDVCTQQIGVIDTTAPVFDATAIAVDTVCVLAEATTFTSLADFRAAGGVSSDECDLVASTFCILGDRKSAGVCPQIVWRKYGIEDRCGNKTIDSVRIVVGDFEDPEITAPADLTINCEDSQDPSNTGTATATDNCSAYGFYITYADVSTQNADPATSGFYNYTITRTWTATDTCGNKDSDVQVITVQDIEAPTFDNCPVAAINLTNDPGECGATLPSTVLTASDNCAAAANITITNDYAGSTSGSDIGGFYDVGTTTVTVTAADPSNAAGDATCVVTINVTDTEAPVVNCFNATLTKSLSQSTGFPGGDGYAIIYNYELGTWDDNCEVDTATVVPDTVYCSDLGTLTATLTVTDIYGNSNSSCTATINVVDDKAPITNCTNITVYLDEFCTTSITPVDIDKGLSYDNCGIVSQSLSKSVFDQDDLTRPAQPPVPVTVYSTDQSGNIDSSCVALVTVRDTIAPVLTCRPTSQQITVIAAPGVCEQYVIVPVPSTGDNCLTTTLVAEWTIDGNTSNAGQAIDNFPVGTTTVTYTIFDRAGNSDFCTVDVTVLDQEDPNAVCAPYTVSLDASGSATVNGIDIDGGSNDNCSIDTYEIARLNPGSGGTAYLPFASSTTFSCTDLGSNPVKLLVTDPSGNTDECSTTVTVVDDLDPICSTQDITVFLTNAPNGEVTITPADIVVSSSDNCTVVDTTIDVSVFGCSGPFCGSDYTVTATVTDQSGNTGTCTATVTVEDTIAPTPLCKSADILLDPNGNGIITVDSVKAGVSDNCGVVSEWVSPTAVNCDSIGNRNVTYYAEDICGNVDSCVAVVDVRDEVSPYASCQNFTLQLDATGNTRTIVPADVDNAQNPSFDACGISSYALDITDFDCNDVGVNQVTLTVVDNYNNQASCIALVTVEDNVAPNAVCAADFTIQLSNAQGGNGSASITVADINNGSNDNCSVATTTIDKSTFGCGDLGDNVITLTVTDVNGNSSTCTTTVTVEDVNDPIITSSDLTVCNDAGVCETNVTGYQAFATDNCSVDSTSVEITINPEPWSGYTGPLSITRTNTLDASYTYPVGTHTVRFYAEDQSGNSSFTTQTVTVNDCENPVLVGVLPNGCDNDQVLPNVTGDCYQQAGWTAPTATDNCMVDRIDQIFSDPTIRPINFGQGRIALFPVGVTTIQYIAYDMVGNADSCSFTITVEDTEDPVIKLNGSDCATNPPANIAVNTDPGLCTSQVILPSVVAEDNCDGGGPLGSGVLTLTNNVPAGGVFQVGTTPVVYTATDPWGNTTTCSFDVTVTDAQNPTITCPANVTVNNDPGACSAEVTYSVTGSDNCTGVLGFQGVFNPANWAFTNGGGDASVSVANAPASISMTSSDNGIAAPGILSVTILADGVLTFDWDYSTANSNSYFDRFGYSLNGSFVRLTRDNGLFTGAPIQNGTESVQVTAGDVFAFEARTADGGNGAATTTVSNLDFQVEPVMLGGLASGSAFPVGTTLNAYRVTDLSGNAATCTFTVTVNDTEAPVVVCPPNQNVQATAGCTAQVNVPAAAAYDNCGTGATPITVQSADFNTAAMPAGWSNTGAGCATGWDFTVNATGGPLAGPGNINGTPMAIFCDDSLGIDCSGDRGELTTASVDATAFSGLTLNFDYNYRHGEIDFPSSFDVEVYNGTNWVNVLSRNSNDAGEWNATGPGPFSSASLDVSAYNNANFQVRFIYDDGGTAANVDTAWNWYAAVDNYMLVGTQLNPVNDYNNTADASDVYPVGTTTVTYTAADASGNTATCTFDVTVTDNGAPAITCPADQTVNADPNNCGAVVTYAVTATDGCDPNVATSLVSGLGSGGYFPVGGPYTETVQATDGSGNADTCSFTITVVDATNPIITGLPGTINVNNDPGLCSAVVTWDESVIITSDNCPGESLTSTHSTGATFPVGTTTVTYTATDASGNTSSGSFDVVVTDNEAPNAICQNAVVQLDANGNGSITTGDIDNGSNDNCGIASLSLDKTSFGCADVGANTVTLTVTDVNGNSSTCTATVDVQDNVAPVALCQNAVVQLDANGDGSITAGDIDNGSNDACGIASLSLDKTSFGCADVGANTVTLTVTDVNGNSSTCTATVDVQDNVAPDAQCQNAVVQLNGAGLGSITTADIDNGSSDACGIASLSLDKQNFNCSDLGTNTVTLTVTDVNGNSSTCTATVDVQDNIAPTFTTCPSNQTLVADAGANCTAVATWAAPTATDNCGATISQTAGLANGASFPLGTTTVSFEATDASGNSATCSFDITVNAPPVFASILTQGPVELCADDANTSVSGVRPGSSLPPGYTGQWTATPAAGVSFGSPTSGTTSVSFTGAGSYTLTWTVSACGVSDSDDITVNVTDAPTTTTAGIDPTTVGGTDGQASVAAAGGSGNFSYLWDDAAAQTGATATGLGAGTYVVTVTDNVSGCVVTDTVVLSDPALINICQVLDFQNAAFGVQFGGRTNPIPGGSAYSWRNGAGSALEYASGEIRIVGEIYDRTDTTKRWIVDIWLINETFWTQWNNAGNTWFTDFTPVTNQFQTWKYYNLDASRSRMFGQGFFAGEILLLTPNSARPNEGWQKGDRGANGKDGDFGVGGTFEYTSVSNTYSGNGGLFADYNGCRNPQRGVRIAPVAMLEGAYDANTGLMRDDLRSGTVLPTTEPYTGLGYTHVNGGGNETVAPAVFAQTGNDAIVDWVVVELRDRNNPALVAGTRSALIQRDGDIVDVDGTSAVFFQNVNEGDYYVVVTHRSHLAIMTAGTQAVLATAGPTLDFTTPTTATYGSGAQKLNSNGVCLLYGGDANANGQVQNTDDVQFWMPQAGTAGYQSADYDLNGQVQNTDRVYLWMQNAGRGSQTPVRQN